MSNTTSTVLELDATFPEQDYVLIGGDKSPGKATILRPNSPRGWDERKGYALTNATLVPSGNPLGEFDVLFEFWDPADMPAWYAFAAKYFDESVRIAPGTMTPRALSIYHPVLAAPPIRITQVVVTNATGLEKTGDTGLWSCTVSFKKYGKPKEAAKAPQAAIAAASAATPTAMDAYELEMQDKKASLQNLAMALGLSGPEGD